MNIDLTKEVEKIKASFDAFEGSFLAGGAITSIISGKPVNDWDVYFKSEKAFRQAVEDAYDNGYWCISITTRALTFKYQDEVIQFMFFRWFETAQEIFDSFDFTVCMGAYDADTKELTLHPRFMPDLAAKALVFNHNTSYPLASGLRVRKYYEREYSISKTELLKVIMAINQKKIETWEDYEEQVGGMYGESIATDKKVPFSLDAVVKSIPDGRQAASQITYLEERPVEDETTLAGRAKFGIPETADDVFWVVFHEPHDGGGAFSKDCLRRMLRK